MNKKVIDIDNIDLSKLKARLRYGDLTQIAEQTGYTLTYVGKVLDPDCERWNEKIIRGALKVVASRKIEIDEDLANSLVA